MKIEECQCKCHKRDEETQPCWVSRAAACKFLSWLAEGECLACEQREAWGLEEN